MIAIQVVFWLGVFIVFYSYVGYGILLFFIIRIRRLLKLNRPFNGNDDYFPDITLLVAAYNEKDYVDMKIHNSLALNYPKEKLKLVWVTDGSDDGTPDMLAKYPGVIVHHQAARNGKIAAMNRAVKLVTTPIIVFSDANTMLGPDSIRLIVDMFRNPKVGCVSGEKRIRQNDSETAAAAGEGIYWKYESTLKKWDAEWYSVVGAAGELFAVRTELYQDVEPDTLLDDFIISLRIAMRGYTIQYNPEAYASEIASANVKEELKRKIRISAGGIQSIVRLRKLLNIFKYGRLSFQYISHRVLRWSLAPLSLLIILLTNLFLILNELKTGDLGLYALLMAGQILFYLLAITGWILENHQIRIKLLFVPYYFLVMNYSVYMGFIRYLKKKQSVNWERAKRATT
ncbi:MAG: glycosyltransferase family 2 protein [Bacteroidales bacterium]|jgi:cellulose synthase/poly-beta-1,6-N-acetylglucosamine synthase-like glycosyltransferase